jgi:hypothetical protein
VKGDERAGGLRDGSFEEEEESKPDDGTDAVNVNGLEFAVDPNPEK